MDIERAIEFILEQQGRSEAAFAELRENQIQIQKYVLAREAEGKVQREVIGAAMLRLVENNNALDARIDRLSEAQRQMTETFNAFVRYTNERFAKVEAQVDDLRRTG